MRRVVSISVALLAVAGILVFATSQESTPGRPESSVSLQGVSEAELESNGITLEALAADYYPRILKTDAEKVAKNLAFVGDASIRETILARVVERNRWPFTDRAAWIINFRPEEVPVPGMIDDISMNKYALVIIDAETGEFITASISTVPLPGVPRVVPLPPSTDFLEHLSPPASIGP